MDTTLEKHLDPYNTAVTSLLRARKAELRATFPEIEKTTGIKLRQLKALFNDEVPIRLGDFMLLCTALELDAADAIASAELRVSNSQALQQR